MGVAKKLIDKKLLRDLVPINALSAVHIEEICKKTMIADVRAGRFVFKKGDRDYQSVYVLEGKIELIGEKGEVVGQVTGGSETARHPLAHKQPRQLSARAAGNVVIACVDSNLLDVLLTWDESAGYDVVEIDAQDDDDWMTRMLQSQAFLQLPPSNIHQLLMRLETVSARAGDVIVRQGDEGDYFYIVKGGRLAVTRKATARSKDVQLAELAEGACFGEEALVADTKRNASVVMITDGDLMRLSKQDFRELLCTPLVHEIDFAQAQELVSQGAEWLDVRVPGEFENQSIKGSRNMPLSALRDDATELSAGTTYIVCCDTGRRSAAGAFVLSQRGFSVYTLKKGLMGVPEAMLTTAENRPQTEAVQDADIIPFESENREAGAGERGAPQSGGAPGGVGEGRQKDADSRPPLDKDVEQLVAGLEQQQREYEKRSRQLEQELAQVRNDYKQLGQRASALGGERDAALSDLEKARADIEALKSQLNNRQGAVDEQVETLEKRLEESDRELAEARNQRRHLEQRLDESGAARQALQQELETLGQQAGAQTAEKDTISADLKKGKERLAELESALQAAEERERSLRKQVEDLEQTSAESLAQLRDEASGERQSLDQRIAELQAALEERARLTDDGQSRQAELERQLADAQQALEEAGRQGQERLMQSEEAERAAEEAVERLRAESSAAREAFERQIVDLETQLEEKNRRLDEQTAHYTEVQQQLAVVNEERGASSGREQSLRENLQSAERQLEESRQALERAEQRAGELEQQLGTTREQQSGAQSRIAELETSLKKSVKEYQSDIDSVRGALARAQDERENIKRDQKRLMDDLRKAESALAQARQDHEAEVYRLRKELKDSAGESSSGLAAEIEALQEQLSQHARQREELELNLGSRSEQLEDAQSRIESLHRQLAQAQDSARQAEQQLLETSHAADQEMTVRLEAEQSVQQALREALDKATMERDAHQERLTMLAQEAEDLRGALNGQHELRGLLEQAEAERDRARESELRLQQEIDQLRAEAEVTRGLVDMVPSGNGDGALREELVAIKKNVEVAVRLRSQAEAKAAELEREVRRLEAEMERMGAAGGAVTASIPSLDADDPGAAAVLNLDAYDPDQDDRGELQDDAPAPAGLLDGANLQNRSLQQERAPDVAGERRGGWKSVFAGLLMGAVAASAATWWLTRQPADEIALAPGPTIVSETADPNSAAQPAASMPPAEPAPKTKTAPTPPVAWGMSETSDRPSAAAVTSADTSATPPGGASGPARETTAPTEAPENAPQVRQPAGYFRDRLNTGESGPAMVEFNADRYLMGSGPASPNFDERPRHEVQLRRFAISRYETTFEEYERFALDTGRARPNDLGWGRGKRPVINVSWKDATAYAEWLSRQTGRRYRLPTEAEWEFVARAGTGTRFWWGSEVGSGRASCFNCGGSTAGKSTVAVGTFEASSYGVYDMAGNVREWVQDCYAANYSDAPTDGGAVELAGGCPERVVRGGGFSSPSDKLRSTARDASAPQSRLNDIGFRLVREY